MNDQQHLERVSSRIRPAILWFCAHTGVFHMEELRQFVAKATENHIAPGSPDRILRQLRKEGLIDYRLLSRQKSLYQIVGVQEQMRLL